MKIFLVIFFTILITTNQNFSAITSEVYELSTKIYKGKLLERTFYFKEGAFICRDVKNCPKFIDELGEDLEYTRFMEKYYKKTAPTDFFSTSRAEIECDLSRIKENITTSDCLLYSLDKLDLNKCEIKNCSYFDDNFFSNVDKEWIKSRKLEVKEIWQYKGHRYVYLGFVDVEDDTFMESLLAKELPDGYYKLLYARSGHLNSWPYSSPPGH